MTHKVSLLVVLAAAWLLLSGHLDGFLLACGAVSCLLVAYIGHRMDVIDRESHPIHMARTLPGYWLWLGVEIVKANIDVARRVLDPKLPIDPRLFRIKTSQRTDLARVIYANSITLTPGTISTDLGEGWIEVHALSAEAEADLRRGVMDAKVSALERAA